MYVLMKKNRRTKLIGRDYATFVNYVTGEILNFYPF
jgi:hypothetical protein